MFASKEAPEQTHARLLQVIAKADLYVQEGFFVFREYPADAFPVEKINEGLAFVRDETVWSVLLPEESDKENAFKIFSFHFIPTLDNSGFVGWLASHLKHLFGTGILVICGQNSGRGGIFDHWGVPAQMANEVLAEIQHLRTS